jgi:hypothetical protein
MKRGERTEPRGTAPTTEEVAAEALARRLRRIHRHRAAALSSAGLQKGRLSRAAKT